MSQQDEISLWLT